VCVCARACVVVGMIQLERCHFTKCRDVSAILTYPCTGWFGR